MSKKQTLLCLHGMPGVGKDTIADLLVHREGYLKVSFAQGLYAEVAAMFNVPETFMRDRRVKNEPQQTLALFYCQDPDYRAYMYRRGNDLYTPRTSRFHLNYYGTDYTGTTDPLRWVNQTLETIKINAERDIVIPDLRAYRDLRELYAITEYIHKTGSHRLRIVELVDTKALYSPQEISREDNIRLPADSITETIIAERGNIEAVYAGTLGVAKL